MAWLPRWLGGRVALAPWAEDVGLGRKLGSERGCGRFGCVDGLDGLVAVMAWAPWLGRVRGRDRDCGSGCDELGRGLGLLGGKGQ